MPLIVSHTTTITPQQKVRRNDPCLCGSGKKYKKCCLQKEYVYDPSEKGRYIDQVLVWLDTQQWYQERLTQHITHIFEKGSKVEEQELNNLIEAVIFEDLINGRTPLHHAITSGGFSHQDVIYYQSWMVRSVFSFFQVEKIHLGSMLEMNDLVTGKRYEVYEKLATYSAQIGQVMITRIIPYRDKWVMTGNTLGAYQKEVADSFHSTMKDHTKHLSQLDYIYMAHKRKPYSPSLEKYRYTDLSYAVLKKLYTDLSLLYGINLDIADMERQIQAKENVDFQIYIDKLATYHLSPSVFAQLANIILALYQKNPYFESLPKPGPQEQKTVNELMQFVSNRYARYEHLEKDKREVAIAELQEKWLDTPQHKLSEKTPRQAILIERKKLQNPSTIVKYLHQVHTLHDMSQRACIFDKYDTGIRHMQEKNYAEALGLFAQYVNSLNDLPEIFRWYGNVGLCLSQLGEVEVAKQYFQKALKIKPDYETAIINMKNYDDDTIIMQWRKLGTFDRFFEAMDRYFDPDCDHVKNTLILTNTRRFLVYIQKNTVELISKKHTIPFAHVLSINEQFSAPDPLCSSDDERYAYKKENQMPQVYFLHKILVSHNLVAENDHTLEITPEGKEFLQSSLRQQWNELFIGWVLDMDWKKLSEPRKQDILVPGMASLFQQEFYTIGTILNKKKGVISIYEVMEELFEDILSPNTYTEKQKNSLLLIQSLNATLMLFVPLSWFGLIELYHFGEKIDENDVSPQWIRKNMRCTLLPLGRCIYEHIEECFRRVIPEVLFKHLNK
ncbi:MAG: SEC-C metal-binding domain-containing protein [Candidatus Roizmanbacteria bacterium]|nr:SEC-C metal-binding domain-containing protein [Candidatus Roizmanbacteria bacterium]